jgi:hypothetical protein
MTEPGPEDQGENEIMGWDVDERTHYDRDRRWYLIAGFVAGAMLILAILTMNYLFAVIIILTAIVYIYNHGQAPLKVRFSVTDEGVRYGSRFYDFDDLKDFSIVYKPKLGINNLYFEVQGFFQQRLSIPLGPENPLPIRQKLLQYLPEDKDRTEIPLSEALARMLRL